MELDRSRLGWFFVFVGLILWVIYFTTEQALSPSYGYFFGGAAILFLGISLVWRYRKVDEDSKRFRTLRSARDKFAQRKTRKDDE